MLRISKQSDQALSILTACARSPRSWIQTRNAAMAAGTSRDRAAQIVHMLSNEGLLETRRGRNGGIRLALDARTIRVGDVVRLTEPGLRRVTRPCSDGGILRAAVEGATVSFLKLLDTVSIGDVALDPQAAIRLAGSIGAITICPFAMAVGPDRLACQIHH